MTNYLMKLKDRQKVEIVSMDMWNPYRAAVKGCAAPGPYRGR
ncbi:ISL3 family transposase [Pseudomonas paraeruginosa]|nr:ISL3 family transposase [Pseudomonas aeruginosa]